MLIKVRTLEDSFIAYDLGKNYEGYETYLVYMEIKGGSLSATYNENGKLIRVIEEYKDVKLPLLLFILYTKPTQVGKLLMTGICTPKRRYKKNNTI
jgi:hypothetical protein